MLLRPLLLLLLMSSPLDFPCFQPTSRDEVRQADYIMRDGVRQAECFLRLCNVLFRVIIHLIRKAESFKSTDEWCPTRGSTQPSPRKKLLCKCIGCDVSPLR